MATRRFVTPLSESEPKYREAMRQLMQDTCAQLFAGQPPTMSERTRCTLGLALASQFARTEEAGLLHDCDEFIPVNLDFHFDYETHAIVVDGVVWEERDLY